MKKFLVLALILFCNPAWADEAPAPSLFFTDAETQAVQALENRTERSQAAADDIQLDAIIYYAPQDWSLWIQGTQVTPETARTDMQVMEVQPEQVRLKIAGLEGSPAREITLKPHQTYQMATGTIIEGLR